MCGYYNTPIPDIYLSSKTETSVRRYAKAWNEGSIDSILKEKKAMNLKVTNKHTMGTIVKDKDNKPWIKIVPIQFTIDDCKDDGEASFRSTGKSEIINMFHDKPELIEGTDKIRS